ncbi:MAG TPA: hypothetical protein VGL63_04815 [Streptosporangiaceae bacterium]
MPAQPRHTTQAEQDDLAKLATALAPLGCKTILTTRDGRPPHLDALNPAAALSGRIYASASHFWWSHAGRIASRDQIPAAAQAIAAALAAPGLTPAR